MAEKKARTAAYMLTCSVQEYMYVLYGALIDTVHDFVKNMVEMQHVYSECLME